MPASKAKVIEKLAQVKNLGETYANAAYEDLKVRNLEDLIEAAKANKLQEIKGIGAAKEKKILASAESLKAESAPAPTPEKKSKSSGKDSKSGPKAKKDKPKKDKPKKDKPKKPAADAKKPEPAKEEAPKKEAPKSESSSRPRTTYRPPQPKSRPTIPGLLFKLGKKIIGRILG